MTSSTSGRAPPGREDGKRGARVPRASKRAGKAHHEAAQRIAGKRGDPDPAPGASELRSSVPTRDGRVRSRGARDVTRVCTGGTAEGSECAAVTCPPVGPAWSARGAAPVEPKPAGPGGSSLGNWGADSVGNEPTLSPKWGAESIPLSPCPSPRTRARALTPRPAPPLRSQNPPPSPAALHNGPVRLQDTRTPSEDAQSTDTLAGCSASLRFLLPPGARSSGSVCPRWREQSAGTCPESG